MYCPSRRDLHFRVQTILMGRTLGMTIVSVTTKEKERKRKEEEDKIGLLEDRHSCVPAGSSIFSASLREFILQAKTSKEEDKKKKKKKG